MAASATSPPLQGCTGAVDADSEFECGTWIARRLHAERAAVTVCIEEQHRRFLEDLNEKFGGVLSIQSNIPGVPRVAAASFEAKVCTAAKEAGTSVGESTGCTNASTGSTSPGNAAAGCNGQTEGKSQRPRLIFQKRGDTYCIDDGQQTGTMSGYDLKQYRDEGQESKNKTALQNKKSNFSNFTIVEKKVTVESAWTQVAGSCASLSSRPSDRGDEDFIFGMMQTIKHTYSQARAKTPYQVLEDCVKSQAFEVILAGVILMNAILMTLHLQWLGLQTGYELGFPTYKAKAKDAWPGAAQVFAVFEKIFAVVYAIELVLRFAVYRCRWFWTSIWSYVDTAIVVLALAPWIMGAEWQTNPTVVRLARFGRLLRVVRVMRTSSMFGALKLLVCSISSSVNTLFWSLCVLLLIQTFAGMLISYCLIDFLTDQDEPLEVRKEVFAFFGTFWRSTVTMFEIVFANWGPICRLLFDNVDESSGIFFLVYRCVIGFAILAVIQAVFIQQTMKTATLDDEFCLEMKTRDKALFVQRLRRVFHEIDKNGDGVISWAEFEPIMEDSRMQALMSTLEINTKDVDSLFTELDDGDGEISIDEFIKGIGNMQGLAKALDLVTVLNICRRIEAKLDAGADWKETRKIVRQWRHKSHHSSHGASKYDSRGTYGHSHHSQKSKYDHLDLQSVVQGVLGQAQQDDWNTERGASSSID